MWSEVGDDRSLDTINEVCHKRDVEFENEKTTANKQKN